MLEPIPNITFSSDLQCPYVNDTLTGGLWSFSYSESLPVLIVVVIVELLIYLTAFFWNLFIVVFMIVKREKLKEPPNVFLFTIAITDLAATLATAPFYIGTAIRGQWFFGNTDCERQGVCMAVGFLLSLLLLYQVNVLAAMAFDRFLAIAKPLHYDRYMTPFRALLIVVAAFVYSVIPSMTPLFGFGVFFFEGRLGACLFRWTEQAPYVGFFVLMLVIPIVIIVVFTLITYWKIRTFLRRRFRHHTRRYTQRSELPKQERRYNKQQRNLLWLFTTLLVILGVCWFPGIVTAIISAAIGTEKVPGPIFLVDLLLVLCNLAANALTHAIFREEIRKAVSPLFKLICCRLCRRSDYDKYNQGEFPSSSQDQQATAVSTVERGDGDGASYKENGRGISPRDQVNDTPNGGAVVSAVTVCETAMVEFVSERETPIPDDSKSNGSTPTEGLGSTSVRFSPEVEEIDGTSL